MRKSKEYCHLLQKYILYFGILFKVLNYFHLVRHLNFLMALLEDHSSVFHPAS